MNKWIHWDTRLFLYSQGMKQGDWGWGREETKPRLWSHFRMGLTKLWLLGAVGINTSGKKRDMR